MWKIRVDSWIAMSTCPDLSKRINLKISFTHFAETNMEMMKDDGNLHISVKDFSALNPSSLSARAEEA